MNLKEFDAKQFMLEKGERVGLGVALTLMVLMLIFSLFMPSSGFFSGSPSAKAQPLEDGSKKLTNDLNTRQPGEKDLPDKDPKGRLIALDSEPLRSQDYEMSGGLFHPNVSDTPTRRPPEILSVVEAAAEPVRLPIDTYIFSNDFSKITVLLDKGGGRGGNMGGANNPMSQMMRMMGRSGGSMPGGGSGGGSGGGRGMMPGGMQGMFGRSGRGVQGAEEKPEYEAKQVPLNEENAQGHLARQVRPAHMVIVEASFPYKDQLNQFKEKLRLPSTDAVLNEGIEYDDKDKTTLAAFRFTGVEVQRQELDEYGKVVKDWDDLPLAEPYKAWLQHSGLPFEEEDPKYDPIKPLFTGLVMPRLREFREDYQEAMAMAGPGMPPPGAGGLNPAGTVKPPERKGGGSNAKYPDVARNLKTLQDTLKKLTDAGPKPVAVPPEKFRQAQSFDAFGGAAPNTGGENRDTVKPPDSASAADATIPDHTLLRFVDIMVMPGKTYKYRFKVKMANPNYRRADVASPAYKLEKELQSKDWYTLKDPVRVPSDLNFYVVDQSQLSKGEKHTAGTPLYTLWNKRIQEGQVAFQFQRWVDQTPVDKEGEPVPIGDWAIADRVPVSRGEYIGQTVKVDVPVWKYTQDSYVLPAEDQRRRVRGKVPTGVNVSFAHENPDGRETILVDFEGGTQYVGKLADASAIEVLLLTPDGKLLARNSGEDSKDEEREKRREDYVKRVDEVRDGKKTGNAGGLDGPRGGRGNAP